MALQRRFGYGLLAAGVGNLALAAGGRLSGTLDVTASLVLLNFAITLLVLSVLQITEVTSFDVPDHQRKYVSFTASALVIGGLGLFLTGAVLAVDGVLS